ncbi:MAG: hypothetical protein M3512_02245, partial [Bacteroidota bacterium]|nr:hypothetical protein [Bacteroidota bacterium]
WQKRGYPYYLSGEFEIRNNVNGAGSLTIAPGTEINFLPGAGILVDGTFIADGTSNPIIFTVDEANRSDTKNYWGGIIFTSGTSSSSKMVNCKVSYGGFNTYYTSRGMIHCSGTSNTPTIKDNQINNSANHGISLDNASPVMSGNTFLGNNGENIYTR